MKIRAWPEARWKRRKIEAQELRGKTNKRRRCEKVKEKTQKKKVEVIAWGGECIQEENLGCEDMQDGKIRQINKISARRRLGGCKIKKKRREIRKKERLPNTDEV